MLALGRVLLATAAAVTTAREASLKDRPMMKVVRLLQDMAAELQRDLDDDKAVHEKLDCWCKANDKEKSQAIAVGEAKASELEAFLGEAAARMGELKAKRDASLQGVNQDEAALHEASTLRMQDNQAFHSEEVNLVEAIKACDQALVVLGKHNAGLAQVQQVAQALQQARIMDLGRHAAKAEDLLALRGFLAQASAATSFLAVPGYQSYAPQSGQVFGVLSQMKEEFERDLAAAQEKEHRDASDYASLKAAKEQEISAGRKLVAELDQEIASLKEKHAQAFKELEDTKAQLDLDRSFLVKLQEKCSESDAEFDKRVKDRMDEIVAVQDTIKILNDDDAFVNFDKTVNSFLQSGSVSSAKDRLLRARSALTRAAAATGAPELSLLAARLKLDAFTKVKEDIDKMVIQLHKQQQDEIDHRDWCIDEQHTNKRNTEEAYDAKASLDTKITDLKKSIDYLTKEIDAATHAVSEMQEQMKRASEMREAENADYQQTVADQRVAQTVLAKALNRMKQVYSMLQQSKEEPGAPHIQTSGTHTDPGNGPARFTKYEQHAGGARVVRMIEEVIADSHKTEDEAIRSEQDAQSAYENFMKDSNKGITAYTEKIVNMKGALGQAGEDHAMAKSDLKATVAHLEDLNDESGNLHKSCDFIINTFDARQAARTAEIEALGEAKAILSGTQ